MSIDSVGTELAPARVARRLREGRVRARLSVRAAANMLGISHTVIVKYEGQQLQPSLDRLEALAHLYGTTAAALLAERDDVAPIVQAIECAESADIARWLRVLAQPADQ